MANLTSKQRENLDKSDFAIPEKAPGPGSYPIPDKAHARNALARVAQFGSPSEISRVRRKVHERFPEIGEGKEPEPRKPRARIIRKRRQRWAT